ncbi:MAG TPA: hypothetical protein VN174_02385 [Candidatus Methanoperedens sp.]|nr:hypothetical protein [Candidatus Methanoperedens sp.]
MPEINTRNGVVEYGEGEKVKSTEELLASGTVVAGSGFGFAREPKATDLSPVKPIRKKVDKEGDEIVRQLVMGNPLNRLPEVREKAMPFLTPVL